MTHSKSGGRELVGDGRIDALVVRRRVVGRLRRQSVRIHCRSSQNDRKEFVVGDVLQQGLYDPSGFLVQDLVTPMRIDVAQAVSNEIVLT